MADKCILVIEDDPDIARLVSLHLADQGYGVDRVADGNLGLSQALSRPFDLVILDLMLPGTDGTEICRRMRAQDIYTPILMLTARTSELDRVLGLELGADDYLTKPFSIRELVARVKALLRRATNYRGQGAAEARAEITVGELQLDPARRLVRLRDEVVELTAREFDLLWYFASHPGRVFSRAQLLDAVWGYGHDGYEHTVNSHINRLRGKIEDNPARPRYVLTVWGVGYKFVDLDPYSVCS